MRMLKGRRRRARGPRVRRSYPNILTDVFSDCFEDEYELGDEIADWMALGGSNDNKSTPSSGNGG